MFSEPWHGLLASWGVIIGGIILLPIILFAMFAWFFQ